MYSYPRYLKILLLLSVICSLAAGTTKVRAEKTQPADKLNTVFAEVLPGLKQELSARKLELGSPIFIRIFKMQGQLEVWVNKNNQFKLFKTYPVCNYSGYLGPKLHEGDWQSPEGFYRVTADMMNPQSNYHLAFNIGYPNDYDTALQRDGGSIMVHGGCSSMGCFAMSNHRMEEIYALAHFALQNGQESFAVHIFPFPLTENNLDKFHSSPWSNFWKNLQEGFIAFEQNYTVPSITVEKGKYVVEKTVRLALSPNNK